MHQSVEVASLCAHVPFPLADGVLSLGDEILSVNGRSLLGLNHSQAVGVLQTCGPDVTLCVRPNHTYRGMHTLLFVCKDAVMVLLCRSVCLYLMECN